MEIYFDVMDPAAFAGEYDYIHLADPSKEIQNMKNADEIVISDTHIRIEVDYPLSRRFEFNLCAPDSRGWSRARIVKAISVMFQTIYNVEDRTSENIAEYLPGLRRNRTRGLFGINGYVLEDLILLCVRKKSSGLYDLYVDSESDLYSTTRAH